MQVKEHDLASTIHGGTAVQTLALWLDGAYRAGDEPAMLSVIRRETCSELSDAEIKGVVYAAFDDGCDAAAVLTRILDAERRESGTRTSSPPR